MKVSYKVNFENSLCVFSFDIIVGEMATGMPLLAVESPSVGIFKTQLEKVTKKL